MSKENGDSEDVMTEVTEEMQTEEEIEEKPKTVKRVKKVTATIGPLKLTDLQSLELHKVLTLTNKFHIDFDLREFPADEENPDVVAEERLGFAQVPFEISSEDFLVTLFYKLSNLRIGGRVMDVALPEEFTQEVEAIKKRHHEERQKAAEARRQEQLTKKRFIYMTNLPETVEEETVRSFFPDCLSVMDVTEGEYRYIKLEFSDHEVAQKCLDENKDVEIGEKSVKLGRYPPGEKKDNRDKKPDSKKNNRDRRGDRSRAGRRDATWSKPKPLVAAYGRPSLMAGSRGGYSGGRNWGSGVGKGDYYQRGYDDGRGGFEQNRYMGKPAQASYSQVRDYASNHMSGYRGSYSGGYGGQGKRKSDYDAFERAPTKRPYTGSYGGRDGRNVNYDNFSYGGGYGRFGGGGGY